MPKLGFDQDALIGQFADASARQGEALRKAVQEATLKALQGRELTLKNIKAAVQQVTEAAATGASKNPLGADQMAPLLNKAIAGLDGALLQAVEANRTALQQMVDQGANLRETQLKKALSEMEKMEDAFFSTVRKAVADGAGPLQGAWGQALDKFQIKGGGAGEQATQAVADLTDRAQDALRDGRAMGLKVAQAMLDSYAAVAGGVLMGMVQGLQSGGAADAPAAKTARRK